jgi:molybdopterin converting factor small subunit
MPFVMLRAPLSELAGGRQHRLDGDDVRAVLVSLESARPALTGWVLDEQRAIRQHVNVYVNGELAEETTPVRSDDRIHVLPAITGG